MKNAITKKINGFRVTVKNSDANTRRIHIYVKGEKMPFVGTSSTMNDADIEFWCENQIKLYVNKNNQRLA